MQNLLQCYFHLQKSLEDVLMVCKTLKMQSFVGQFCIINLMNLCLYSNTKGGFLSGNKAIDRLILGWYREKEGDFSCTNKTCC